MGWANLVIFSAALFSSITGFGYALLATPVLLLFLAPKIVVPIVLMSSMPLSLLLAREAYSDMSKAKIGLWLLGALPGMVFGAYGLAHFDEGVMRVGIGAVTILAALSVWSKPDSPFVKERMMAIVAGGGQRRDGGRIRRIWTTGRVVWFKSRMGFSDVARLSYWVFYPFACSDYSGLGQVRHGQFSDVDLCRRSLARLIVGLLCWCAS